ncbi:hypothetical protein NDU88_004838 [Pleurodeles waltl]|uniref:Uncharacterized protein n=1 Tax=Pleurodeles waltl TaxID=8319 RepID=A0AAV7LJV4_PLEWA|nr:hypothetical protein NDU88_004838 [Pleurodeles waltl]
MNLPCRRASPLSGNWAFTWVLNARPGRTAGARNASQDDVEKLLYDMKWQRLEEEGEEKRCEDSYGDERDPGAEV